MPWRFVEMYGRMQFSDIVVFQALEENNRVLRLLGRADEHLPLPGVQGLALSVRRLTAAWALFDGLVTAEVGANSRARLLGIDGMLAPTLLADIVPQTLNRLSQRSDDARVQASFAAFEAAVRRALVAAPVAPPLLALSVAFQAESSAWQQMPPAGTRESDVLDAFERGYRLGRELAWRQAAGEATETLAEWRCHAESTFYQLDSIRRSLGDDNRARRWCLGRLIDALCKHEALLAVRRWLPEVTLARDSVLRIEALLEAHLDETRSRAVKLVAHAYAASPAEFRAHVRADVDAFALAVHQPLPRSA
jgi:hypothetical protein